MAEARDLSPIFADILQSIEQQPTLLARAQRKADARRFSGEPITGFATLDEDTRSDEERAADHAYHLQEMADADRYLDEERQA